MTLRAYYCHKCGAPWDSDKCQPGFKETCAKCSAYLHCCKNCRFHRLSAHNQCAIPNTDWVGNRSGLNFCEEFEFRTDTAAAEPSPETRDSARNAFDCLFHDDAATDTRPKSFDDLFRKPGEGTPDA